VTGPQRPVRPDAARAALRDGDWSALRADAARVRLAVFVAEQGFSEALEWDAYDPVSLHVVAYADDAPIATGRLLPDGRIGRMAVLRDWRGCGVGARLLEHLVSRAAARGDGQVVLSAQVRAIGFYERYGFRASGPVHDDEGVPHRTMHRPLLGSGAP